MRHRVPVPTEAALAHVQQADGFPRGNVHIEFIPCVHSSAPPNDKIFTKSPKHLEQYRYTIKQERKSKKPWAISGSVLIIYAFGAHGKSFP